MRPQKYHPDMIQEAREMRADGLSYQNIANYLGFSNGQMVSYHLSRKAKKHHQLSVRKWNEKNKEHKIKMNREYCKRTNYHAHAFWRKKIKERAEKDLPIVDKPYEYLVKHPEVIIEELDRYHALQELKKNERH